MTKKLCTEILEKTINLQQDKRDVIIEKVKEYIKPVKQFFPVNIDRFYLFGSYAKGTFGEYSDIDVALVVAHLDDDYNFLETEPVLWRLRHQIDERIEPHIIAEDRDYAGFLDEIQKTGIEIKNL